MISLLKKIFIDNWLRKLISFLFSIIIWFVVDQTLTTTKTINAVGVRIINLPQGKTVNGLQNSGLLNKRVSITITGKKFHIEELTSNDLEVLLDANGMGSEWVVTIDKRHLISLNPELSIAHHISKTSSKNLVLKLVQMTTEKIPVYVSQPIGECPKGYQFLDIWPYHLNMTVSGPEEVIKKLKSRGFKLTFNMSEISSTFLDRSNVNKKSVVSYYIPEQWKVLNIPSISDVPLSIDDPDARLLRLDFIRTENEPINFSIPINLFVPPERATSINPSNMNILNSDIVQTVRGVKVLNKELSVKGVSDFFLKVVKDMVALSVNITPKGDQDTVDWSLQFINPSLLEDRYLAMMVTEAMDDELRELPSRLREEYLRNRFRNYMNRFQLYTSDGQPLKLDVELKGKEIVLKETTGSTE